MTMNATKAEVLTEDPTMKVMVDRFLNWKLPQSFQPDCGISFNPHPGTWPIGTNVFTATEARQMLEHVVGAELTSLRASRDEAVRERDAALASSSGMREALEWFKSLDGMSARYYHVADSALSRVSALAQVSAPAPARERVCEFCQCPLKAGSSVEYKPGKFAHVECNQEHNEAILAENNEVKEDRAKAKAKFLKEMAEASAKRSAPSREQAYEQRQKYACDVCGNVPDEHGVIEHGRGCYTQSSEGGGTSYVEFEKPAPSREQDAPPPGIIDESYAEYDTPDLPPEPSPSDAKEAKVVVWGWPESKSYWVSGLPDGEVWVSEDGDVHLADGTEWNRHDQEPGSMVIERTRRTEILTGFWPLYEKWKAEQHQPPAPAAPATSGAGEGSVTIKTTPVPKWAQDRIDHAIKHGTDAVNSGPKEYHGAVHPVVQATMNEDCGCGPDAAVTLTTRDFRTVEDLLKSPPPPNDALKQAFEDYRVKVAPGAEKVGAGEQYEGVRVWEGNVCKHYMAIGPRLFFVDDEILMESKWDHSGDKPLGANAGPHLELHGPERLAVIEKALKLKPDLFGDPKPIPASERIHELEERVSELEGQLQDARRAANAPTIEALGFVLGTNGTVVVMQCHRCGSQFRATKEDYFAGKFDNKSAMKGGAK